MTITMKLVAVFFVTVLFITLSDSTYIDQVNGYNTSISNMLSRTESQGACIAKYVVEKFEAKDISVIAKKSDYVLLTPQQVINHLHRAPGKRIYVTNDAIQSPRCETTDFASKKQYLIFVDSTRVLETIISYVLCIRSATRAHFILVVPFQSLEEVDPLLDVLRKYGVDRGTLITLPEEGKIKYWRSKHRCFKQYGRTFNFFCNVTEKQTTQFELNSLLKCPIRIGVRQVSPYAYTRQYIGGTADEYDGIEIDIARMFLDVNKVCFITGSFDELLAKLKNHEISMMLGGLQVPNEDLGIDPTYPHLAAKMIAVVKRKTSRNFLSLFKTLSTNIWIAFLVIQGALIIVAFAIAKRTHTNISIPKIMFNFFAITIGQSAQIYRHPNLKIVLIAWIWTCFFLKSAFEAVMYMTALKNDESYQINKVDDLCAGTRQVFTFPEYQKYFSDGLTLSTCQIPKEHFNYSLTPFVYLSESVEADLSSMILFEYSFKAFEAVVFQESERSSFHILNEPVYLIPLTFYFHHGDLLSAAASRPIRNLGDYGLFSFQESVSVFITRLYYNRRHPEGTNDHIIRMEHVGLVFELYLWGVLMACVAFAAEVLIYKFRNRIAI